MTAADWIAAIDRLPNPSRRVALAFAGALVDADWSVRRLLLSGACSITPEEVDAAIDHMRTVGLVMPTEKLS